MQNRYRIVKKDHLNCIIMFHSLVIVELSKRRVGYKLKRTCFNSFSLPNMRGETLTHVDVHTLVGILCKYAVM